jgi:hypothetical protein
MCEMAPANGRNKAFARAHALSTSLTLMGKAEMKKEQGAGQGFRRDTSRAVDG